MMIIDDLVDIDMDAPISLGNIAKPPLPWSKAKKKEEGKTQMYNESKTTIREIDGIEADQRKFLLNRLSELSYTMSGKLDKMFNRYVNNEPKSAKELIDAITGGKFTYDQKKVDAFVEYNGYAPGGYYGITWDGPQSDDEGRKVAKKEWEVAYRDAEATIQIMAPVDGLAALKALQDWNPSNAPKN